MTDAEAMLALLGVVHACREQLAHVEDRLQAEAQHVKALRDELRRVKAERDDWQRVAETLIPAPRELETVRAALKGADR